MTITDDIILIVSLACCVGVTAFMVSKLRRSRKEARVIAIRERARATRKMLLDTADPLILELSEYAQREGGGLHQALATVQSEERAESSKLDADDEEEDNEEEEGDEFSWLTTTPEEIILNDLLQIQFSVTGGTLPNDSNRLALIPQFGAATENEYIADVSWSELSGLIEDSLKKDTPELNGLKLLAATRHPDRHTLRELYIAFARLSHNPDFKHLPFALEEISRAARTVSEIKAESDHANHEQVLRWAHFMIDFYKRDAGSPVVVEALAAYAERSSTGMTQVVTLYKKTQDFMPNDLSSSSLMLIDLCSILMRLSFDMPTPTKYQAGLIKTFDRSAGRYQLSSETENELYAYIRSFDNAEFLGIRALALMGHRDRFILRDLYVEFARKASKRCTACKARLAAVEQEIIHSAMTLEERGGTGEPTVTGPTLSARQILGVDETASPEQIRQAYHLKVQRWHPDRLSGMADELQTLANEKLAEVNEAYASLRNG